MVIIIFFCLNSKILINLWGIWQKFFENISKYIRKPPYNPSSSRVDRYRPDFDSSRVDWHRLGPTWTVRPPALVPFAVDELICDSSGLLDIVVNYLLDHTLPYGMGEQNTGMEKIKVFKMVSSNMRNFCWNFKKSIVRYLAMLISNLT